MQCERWIRTALLFLVLGGVGAPRAGAADAAPATPPPASPAPVAASTNILHFGVHVSAMGTLDPHFAAGSQDRALADMLFNGLLRYRPGDAPHIEADLAEAIPDFKMVGGRQVWTFRLRRGVMFHAGPATEPYELTADDVVFSLRKAADPQTSAYAGEYSGMDFEKVDAYTVRVVPAQPLSAILFLPKLTNYAGGFIVSRKAVETTGYEGFKRHPVGTGPFAFQGYDGQGNLLLGAHRRYFRGEPRLDGVAVHFLPDIEQREAGLRSGALDVITGSGEQGWPEMMEQAPGIVVDAHGVGEVVTVFFNTRIKPLDDVRVRRALAYALNREAFMQTTSARFVGPVYSPVPATFLPGGLTREAAQRLGLTYDTDLARARQLLAQAGYPDGFALDLVTSEKRLYRRLYEVLQAQLAQIGVECRVAVEPHSRMHKIIRQDPRPIVIYAAWRPNADVYLSQFFHGDAAVVTGLRPETNFAQYGAIDRLIEAARREIRPENQINLWIQAQIKILDDMAALPLMYVSQCYARRQRVDYGHPLAATMALYPQFTERTQLKAQP